MRSSLLIKNVNCRVAGESSAGIEGPVTQPGRHQPRGSQENSINSDFSAEPMAGWY